MNGLNYLNRLRPVCHLDFSDDAASFRKDQLANFSSGKVLGTSAKVAAALKPFSEGMPLLDQISLSLP